VRPVRAGDVHGFRLFVISTFDVVLDNLILCVGVRRREELRIVRIVKNTKGRWGLGSVPSASVPGELSETLWRVFSFREKFFAFLLVVVGVVRCAFNQTQTTISAKKQARRARRLVDAWR
jgi:hypothetical protein